MWTQSSSNKMHCPLYKTTCKKDYLEKYLWGGEFWNDGSTIISVGASASIDVLITYIKNQAKADKP